MSSFCCLLLVLMCYTFGLDGQDNSLDTVPELAVPLMVNDVRYRFLKYENPPTIRYKYIVRRLLPMQGQWWKRGTHQIYEKSPINIVEP